MTAYVAGYGLAAGGGGGFGCVQLGVLASTYQIRINKIELFNSTAGQLAFFRYSGASMSSGVSVTPAPLRQGAPASTATARAGTYNVSTGTISAMSISGSATWLHSEGAAGGSDKNYQFAYDAVIAPGSAFYLVLSPTTTTTPGGTNFCYSMAVYYEELRLAWSF